MKVSRTKIKCTAVIVLYGLFFSYSVKAGVDISAKVREERKRDELVNTAVSERQKREQDILNTQIRSSKKKEELVQAVDAYMKRNAPKNKLSAEKIVDLCLKHDYDLPLLLAQGKIESCFGTCGRARRTGSVFGVGAYDNGTNAHTYRHPNDSVEPYIKLVKRKYLGENKSVDDLLRGGYKTLRGGAYASNPSYAQTIKRVREGIIFDTEIEVLYKEYKHFESNYIALLTKESMDMLFVPHLQVD